MDTEYTYIKGVLGYNSRNDRYGLLACDLWEIDGFHCGDILDVWDYDSEQWIPTRIEKHFQGDWYLVGTEYSGLSLEGLRARVRI